MRLDAHHHFWRYNPTEFDWIDDDMAAIRRDFLPADLAAEIRDSGIDGVVSVQARQCLAETTWLLELASRHVFIRGVVGWVPLIAPDVRTALERCAANPKLRAVRHILQGEPDPDYMLRPDFNRGISVLPEFDLTYDILILERQLPQTLSFVDRHPQQRFVLDHIAKPRIRDGQLSPWRENLRELARRPNVWCKISGVVTEADYTIWTPASIRPYLDAALAAFGASRVMFGSDWPVCRVACDYRRWVQLVQAFVAPLSATEQAAIFGGNAVDAYHLPSDVQSFS
jgi:L-fuconolactonase